MDPNSPAATHAAMSAPQSINRRRAIERHHPLSPIIAGTVEHVDRDQDTVQPSNPKRHHGSERG